PTPHIYTLSLHDALPIYFAAPQNSRRNQMQNIFLAAMNDGMAGIVPTLTAYHDIGVGGEHVDDLPLPFVAPLRADQDRVGHDVSDRKSTRLNSSHVSISY